MTLELLLIFFVLYFLTVTTYPSGSGMRGNTQSGGAGGASFPAIEYNDLQAKMAAQRQELNESRLSLLTRAWLRFGRAIQKTITLMALPIRFAINSTKSVFRFLWDPRLVMLVAYGLVWFHLAKVVQQRSLAVKQHSESMGFREALVSLETNHQTFQEGALWLNQFLSHIWQTDRQTGRCPPSDYLRFVQRGMNGGNDCVKAVGWRRHRISCADCIVYRGMEPHLSQNIGLLFMDVLDTYQKRRPHDIAYASLHSLTLGSKPPIIQSIKSLGEKKNNKDKREFKLELYIPSEVNLVLDIKLSSLHYAMLPSTRIAVSSLGTKLNLLLTTKAGGMMPFVSDLEVSLLEYPDINLRIMPVSDDSGLRGIDIGAFPLIREWIKAAVRETISEYVSPKYISIDMFEWFDTENSHNFNCAANPAVTTTTASRIMPKLALIRPKNRVAEIGLELWMAASSDEMEDDH
eukprot:CAMPEP_0202444500 /NCGR_PEP_ID=MMETSP1360-20130828/3558_1 /ASSEMBLY_ACC=CAM_ASM_000848 /TAXON_ID=515479 /ORGANISM="Licmophora paradoxa, Strain CCMP2313" /LENGTH=460 /DNA_ID=CAMNT_0049060517 /DNA_START=12 /DNA_END=1394 /DNA_ORIENTATION=-